MKTLRDNPAPVKQDPSEATYAPILKKEDGEIDWTWPASKIFNRSRGFLPWPGAFSFFRGQIFHIWKARVAIGDPIGDPGQMIVQKKRLLIVCGEGTMLEPLEVQVEGRKRMSAEAFLNGQHLRDNEKLGRKWREATAGLSIFGRVRRNPQSEKGRPGADCFRRSGVGRGRIHAESRASRAGAHRTLEPDQVARIGERGVDQCGQRQLRHPDRRPCRAGLLRCRCQHPACAAGAGFSGVHRRDRRGIGCSSDRECIARPGRGIGARSI